MSFILVPDKSELGDLQINGWNWRPTLALLKSANVATSEQLEMMSTQGVGGGLSEEQCELAALVIEVVLRKMKQGDRVLNDGTIVEQPTSGKLSDPTIYSAKYEWLVEFVQFCSLSGGFKVL